MVQNDTDNDTWWKEHPLFLKFYCPMIITATFVIAIIDLMSNSTGAHCT